MIIKPILPKNFQRLGSARYQREIEAALDQAARGTVEDMRAIVRTWSKPPTPKVTKRPFEREVTISDARFTWLDEGTRPHLIRAKRRFLVFQAGYRAKTAPGRLVSGSGGPTGPIVHAKVVRHPGIKARHWTQRLKAENQERVSKLVREAIRGVANG